MIKYSLLLLTYNRLGVTARCLRSLAPMLHREDVEWLIVDNASSDGTAQWLLKVAARYPQMRLMLRSDNAGVAGGRQILLDAARGQTLIILDSDVEARHPDWLERLTAPLRERPEVWLCGPGGAFVTPDWTDYEATPLGYAGPVDTISGFCQAFDRRVLDAGFRFDVRFNPRWHEDTDMSLFVQSKGGVVWHTGDVGLFHIFSYTGDDGTGAVKQQYLASKWRGQGLTRAERERLAASTI